MLMATLVGSFVLAAIVFASDSRRLSNRLFAMIAICLGIWSLGILLFSSTTDPQRALAYAKLYYIDSIIFVSLLVAFAFHYPRGASVPLLFSVVTTIATLCLGIPILIDDHFIIQHLQQTPDGWHATVNVFHYSLFVIYFVVYFSMALVIALIKAFSYRGAERKRASFYAFGILITSIPGFIADLLLPYFGDYRYVWIGPVCTVAFLLMTGYSIGRHRMLNIKLFLAKTALYALAVGLASGVYAISIYVLTTLMLGGVASPTIAFVANVTAALIVAYSFVPIKNAVDYMLNRMFHYKRYNSQALINEVTKICVEVTDLTVLIERVIAKLETAFDPQFVGVRFRDVVHHDVLYGKKNHTCRTIECLEQRVARSSEEDKERIFELKTPAQRIGYLVIGRPSDGRVYQAEDERTMAVIADELSVAIQNIFRLEEIRNFARTLEKEVNAATKELRASNNKLMEIDATKDEFVSMASHQLRTPLTSVKGYLSMVLEGDAGEITPAQRRLLEEAFTSSERMVRLIGDFLNVSRLQTGKFVIERHAVDLGVMIEQEVEGMRQIAATRDITIVFKKTPRVPLLYLDENKLRQVVMNFIDNAVYYSPDGSTIRVVLEIDEGDIVMKVIDRGMGVPSDVQGKLFTKFFRAENARKQRPDGTGIGLYLAKRIIVGHKGRVIVNSIHNKGSTFGFRLPIRRLERPPRQDDVTKPL